MQIDYGKLGLLYDPLRQKKRTVYAFIATLSFSRLKFVDIVYRQDQRSFIASHLSRRGGIRFLGRRAQAPGD